jgi:uroporphyrinogen-III synthase
MSEANFGGRRVVSFESRRAVEMASLIERHGGVPMSAPSMREIARSHPEAGGSDPVQVAETGPVPACSPAVFAEELGRGEYDAVVLMTGVGTRALADAVAPAMSRADFAEALSRTRVVARGPKPVVALRELGVVAVTTVAEPNRSREVLAALIAAGPLEGRRIAVQEYGAPSPELYEALRQRGATVRPVAVYRWALPEDTGPLREAVAALSAGEVKIALFTSRAQVEHVFLMAEEEQRIQPFRERLARGVVAVIGPVCAEALRMESIHPDIIPDHPKMGHLVKAAAARTAEVLRGKNSE